MSEFDTGAATAAPEATPIVENSAPVTSEPSQGVNEGPSIRETMASVYDKANPARSEGGQFASKTENSGEAPATAVEPAAETTGQPEALNPEPAAPAIEAPVSWPAEMKAKFGTLPPEVRDFVAKREGEAHKAITQMGQQVKAFEPIRSSLERHADLIRANGVPPDQAIENMFSVAKALETDPRGALMAIAEMHGVDLRTFADGAEPQAQRAPEVTALEQKVAKLEGILTAQQRQQFESEQSQAVKEIETFAKTAPYFDEVRQHVGKLLQAGTAETLADAYEQATWANPTIRERILADQRKADEDKRRAEAGKKATDAKRIAPLNQRSVNGASPSTPASMRESMAAVAAKYSSAG